MYSFNVADFNSGIAYARPEIFLSVAACAILMLDLVLADTQRLWTGALAVPSTEQSGGGAASSSVEHGVIRERGGALKCWERSYP
jgi:hypothetical protein